MQNKWTGMKRLRTLANAEKGTVVVFFALAIVPLVAMVGGFIDFGRAMKVKAELAATLDGAVLAATQARALNSDADVDGIIRDFIDKNYTSAHKNGLEASVVVNSPTISEDGEVTSTADVEVANGFLDLVGVDAFNWRVSSSARVGGQTLEVALVLDTTLSMKGSKMVALKSSANLLVDQLMTGNGDRVKMALVPFADYVNIGMDNRYETGLDIPEDYNVVINNPGGEWCRNEYPNSTQVCTPIKVADTCYNDGVPYACQKTTGYNCTGSKGDPVWTCTPVNPSSSTTSYKWYGCMGSRPYPLNVRDEDYSVGVPGLMSTSNWCKNIAPVVRLTSSKGDVTSGIAKMNADRWTFIPGGLMWGWRALSDTTPFADGVSYDDEAVKKVIVLMTDGDNTLLRKKLTDASTTHHQGQVWAHSIQSPAGAPQTDTHTAELCENIKAKGIIVHTIAYDVEADSPVQTLLRNCAGNGGQYFDASDSQKLADAFNKIALALMNLRLSR